MGKLTAALLGTLLLVGGAGVATAEYADRDRHMGMHERHHGKGYHHDGHRDYGPHRGRCGSIGRMADALDLSDKQDNQLRAIKDKYRPEKRALKDKARASRKQLRELMDKDKVRESDIRKLANEYGKTKADYIFLKKKMKLEMRKVLTKEQREKQKELRKARRYR